MFKTLIRRIEKHIKNFAKLEKKSQFPRLLQVRDPVRFVHRGPRVLRPLGERALQLPALQRAAEPGRLLRVAPLALVPHSGQSFFLSILCVLCICSAGPHRSGETGNKLLRQHRSCHVISQWYLDVREVVDICVNSPLQEAHST